MKKDRSAKVAAPRTSSKPAARRYPDSFGTQWESKGDSFTNRVISKYAKKATKPIPKTR